MAVAQDMGADGLSRVLFYINFVQYLNMSRSSKCCTLLSLVSLHCLIFVPFCCNQLRPGDVLMSASLCSQPALMTV